MVSYYPEAIQQAYESDPRLAMAKLLQQRAQQPVNGSITQGIANLVGQGFGQYKQNKLRGEYDAQASEYNAQMAKMLDVLSKGGSVDDALKEGKHYALMPKVFEAQLGRATAKEKAQADAAAKMMEPYTLGEGDRRFIGQQMISEGGAKTTDDIREWEMAGRPGTLQDWVLSKRQAGATRIQMAPQITMGNEAAKLNAGRFGEVAKEAESAYGVLTTLKTMENMANSGQLMSGPLANAGVMILNIAQSAGIPLSEQEMKTLSNSETFTSASGQFVLDKIGRSLGPGYSEGDRKAIEKIGPQLSNSPQARIQLIKIMSKAAQRSIQKYNSLLPAFESTLQGVPSMYQPMESPGYDWEDFK